MKNFVIHVDRPKEFIKNFFSQKNAADRFIWLAEHLMRKDNSLLIRTDCALIGLSCPGERYWCYAVQEDGVWYIKFKHLDKRFPLCEISEKEYRVICDECSKYYAENREDFLIGVSRKQERLIIQDPTADLVPEEELELVNPDEDEKDREKYRKWLEELNQNQQVVKSCSTCMLRISDRCSELRSQICGDYLHAYHPTQQEKENNPTHGDATSSDSEHRVRYFKGRTT